MGAAVFRWRRQWSGGGGSFQVGAAAVRRGGSRQVGAAVVRRGRQWSCRGGSLQVGAAVVRGGTNQRSSAKLSVRPICVPPGAAHILGVLNARLGVPKLGLGVPRHPQRDIKLHP